MSPQRRELVGAKVFDYLTTLDARVRSRIYEELEELRRDATNDEGRPDSTIQAYRDPRYGHTYSILVAGGRFIIVYQVLQDHPRVWLRGIVDHDTGTAR